ncbi:hypothetical protein CR155_05115 [Pollutimonas nitritireducens]|uniref:Uncharacterized protein n=1 Tax=Pollutimonas nitritireducens TaxID=2045209 RepID=A0A2N4UIK0_9BURK|nr:hypothetical protein [Pollutimonas nitritireducens]PLC54843.1 hypothetical protein CR155_05115 [Pollutimonas nitritireducens]
MWVDLLSMLATAVLAACLVFILGRFLRKSKRKLPRWAMPAAMGCSMIAFSIWSEYSWFTRMQAALPQNVVVLSTGERSAPWAPWTYAAPVTIRFIAMDTHAISRSEQKPQLVKGHLLLVERWQPTRTVAVAFDCAAHLRADLMGNATLAADGVLSGAQWQAVAPTEPALRAACKST